MHRIEFRRFVFLAGFTLVASLGLSRQAASQTMRDFTVADDIGLVTFGNPYFGNADPITVSPDGRFVAVHTERGLIKENRVEDGLRVYDLELLRRFANQADQSKPPEPFWTITKGTYKEGLIISNVRWLSDSRRLAFLVKDQNGHNQLWLAQPEHQTAKALTPTGQDVTGFDVTDYTHFVYTVRNPGPSVERMDPEKVSAFSATGLPLFGPLMRSGADLEIFTRSELWAVRGGKPFCPPNPSTGSPIILYGSGQMSLALAPDGNSVVFAVPLLDVPAAWEKEYQPPTWRVGRKYIHPGRQDMDDAQGTLYVTSYATLDLREKKMSILVDAPTAASAGWVLFGGRPAWSDDSRLLLLPGAFLSNRADDIPCITAVEATSKKLECVEPLPKDAIFLRSVRFSTRSDQVFATYCHPVGGVCSDKTESFSKSPQGAWMAQATGSKSAVLPVALTVRQALNDPPVLVATDPVTEKSGVVWDPNPQLKQIRLSEASVYRWTDASGKQWTGGLYKPVDYVSGRRYPLVIQTHGFVEKQFNPSGGGPSGFAARALAAVGIVVLQVPDCANAYSGSTDEAPCHLRGYESAARQLEAEGLVDSDRVGIIGFSRSCFYVMQALTLGKMRLKAASVVDGVNEGYLQYLLTMDSSQGVYQREMEGIMGAAPIGHGLQQWFQRSPGFNLDKITSPLQVVAHRGMNLLSMWEPYAMLRLQKKPVDLLVLNAGPSQHVLTGPGVRLAAQGGTVDWFRFWLKDEEDPDPAKADQYKRWRELRKLQEANAKTAENKPAEKN